MNCVCITTHHVAARLSTSLERIKGHDDDRYGKQLEHPMRTIPIPRPSLRTSLSPRVSRRSKAPIQPQDQSAACVTISTNSRISSDTRRVSPIPMLHATPKREARPLRGRPRTAFESQEMEHRNTSLRGVLSATYCVSRYVSSPGHKACPLTFLTRPQSWNCTRTGHHELCN